MCGFALFEQRARLINLLKTTKTRQAKNKQIKISKEGKCARTNSNFFSVFESLHLVKLKSFILYYIQKVPTQRKALSAQR